MRLPTAEPAVDMGVDGIYVISLIAMVGNVFLFFNYVFNKISYWPQNNHRSFRNSNLCHIMQIKH